jgi:effector-binding domain-containing protein
MRLLKFLLWLLLASVALICILGLFAKKEFHLERAALIKAPKSMVFEQVRLFSNFEKWSPWQGLDLHQTSSIEGVDGTPGAIYKWNGDKNVGEGTQTIRSVDSNLIKYDIQFVKPFASTANAFYSVTEANGGGTKVVWGFDMKMPFPWNVFGMFTDMNKAVGADYEKGLAKLQMRCEDRFSPKLYGGFEVRDTIFPQRFFASTARTTVNGVDIPTFLAKNYGAIGQAFAIAKLATDGMPCGFYWPSDDIKNGNFDMTAAIPFKKVGKNEPKIGPGITVDEFGGRALMIDFFGKYENTGKAHDAIKTVMTDRKVELFGPAIEEYLNDPMIEKDTAKWLTRVIYFVQNPPKPQTEQK